MSFFSVSGLRRYSAFDKFEVEIPDRMQNSQVISKVKAGLSRCLSHHRRLCDDIAELDKLFCQDEFLLNPRRLWQLIQQQQNRQDEVLEPEKSEAKTDMDSRAGVLSSKERLLSQTQFPIQIVKVLG